MCKRLQELINELDALYWDLENQPDEYSIKEIRARIYYLVEELNDYNEE